MQHSLQLLSVNKTTAFASQLNHKTNIFLNSSLKTHLFAQLNAKMNSEILEDPTKFFFLQSLQYTVIHFTPYFTIMNKYKKWDEKYSFSHKMLFPPLLVLRVVLTYWLRNTKLNHLKLMIRGFFPNRLKTWKNTNLPVSRVKNAQKMLILPSTQTANRLNSYSSGAFEKVMGQQQKLWHEETEKKL